MAVVVGFDAYAVPKKDGYKLVWKDNFDGSALNRDYWNVEVNGSGCGNNELQYYVDNADNVTAIPAGGAEMLVDYVRVYQPKKQISLNIKK